MFDFIDTFKRIIKFKWLQYPLVSISVYLFIYISLDDLNYWISTFIVYCDDDLYSKIIVNYSGPLSILKSSLDYWEYFYDPEYLYNFYKPIIFILFFTALLYWRREKILLVFAEGKARKYVHRLFSESLKKRPLLLIFILLLILLEVNSTTLTIYNAYKERVNKEIYKKINSIAVEHYLTKSSSTPESQVKNTCVFTTLDRSSQIEPVFQLSYPQFLLFFATGEKGRHQKIIELVNSLTSDFSLRISDSLTDFDIIDKKYSKDEVLSLLNSKKIINRSFNENFSLEEYNKSFIEKNTIFKIKKGKFYPRLHLVLRDSDDIPLANVKFYCQKGSGKDLYRIIFSRIIR